MSENASELTDQDLHVLGKISGFYGIKGWLKIYSYTQPRENIVHYKALKIKQTNHRGTKLWQDIKLDQGKAHGKGVVAHFLGYDNRESATHLIGAELAVYRSEFKSTAKDEYYWTDLVDLAVINLEGIELGSVKQLIETAAHDVLVINSKQNSTENNVKADILIPFVRDYFVKQVDLTLKKIVVDWPDTWNN
jgi:16S rRNA processing protein RimM